MILLYPSCGKFLKELQKKMKEMKLYVYVSSEWISNSNDSRCVRSKLSSSCEAKLNLWSRRSTSDNACVSVELLGHMQTMEIEIRQGAVIIMDNDTSVKLH